MINLIEIKTADELKQSLKDSDMYKIMSYTNNIPESCYHDKSIKWFHIQDDNQLVGIIGFKIFCDNCLIFHGGMYKKYRGYVTPEILNTCLQMIKGSTNLTFITMILDRNIPAIKMIKKAGFVEKTILHNVSANGNLIIFAEK